MMIGILGLSLAFIAAMVSTTAYWLYYREEKEDLRVLANRSFFLAGAGIFFVSGLLLYHILIHNFQLNYVYSYSSRDLNTFYLISTFWAGQEGTFLLWLMFGTIFGLILIKTTSHKNPLVLFFFMLVQSFILLILLKKNPFAMIWHVHSEAPVGFLPTNGNGLNPLLQNPWMTIHPPTLFNGFSSTMVPFAYAMAAMVTGNFQGWVKAVRPWVIYSVMMLGAGIILGGYWAYTTLGWGGYWGWDPVENSSLVPWLLSVVLLHGIVIQNKRKGLVRTNLILAGLVFLTVLWGSFLTRSGVLADFSVHSFAESGLNFYLIGFVLLFSLLFLNYFLRSVTKMESPKFTAGIFNREMFMLMGMMSVLFTALVVLIGTASPIYTGLLGKPASVAPDFYNSMGIPITIFMLFSVAIAPVLAWKVSELRNLKLFARAAAGMVVLTIVVIILGMRNPASIVLFALATFVIIINATVSYRILKNDLRKAGGYLTHVGFGFMIIGIITSSMYDRSENVNLPEGEFQKTGLGYEVKFVGFVDMPDGKDRAKLIVKTDHGSYEAYPRFYYSDYSQSYMASPDVKMEAAKDIYISPISFMPAEQANMNKLELLKGESKTLGKFKFSFRNFDIQMQPGRQIVKANLTVSVQENNYWRDYRLQPTIWMENGQLNSDEVLIPNTDYRVRINSVNATSGAMELLVMTPKEEQENNKDILAIEISVKPLITLLWFGTLILIGGIFISLLNRIKVLQIE